MVAKFYKFWLKTVNLPLPHEKKNLNEQQA